MAATSNAQAFGSVLKNLADAIREKANVSGSMTLQQMVQTVASIETGGGDAGGLDAADLYVMRMLNYLPKSVAEQVTAIRASAFTRCSLSGVLSLPNCISIGAAAFMQTQITSLYAPKCKSVYMSAFMSCSELKSAFIPYCLSIYGSAFRDCSKLESITALFCQIVYPYAFQGCQNLARIILPSCSIVYESAFRSCTNLSLVNLGKISWIDYYGFHDCVNLKSLYLLSTSVVNQISGSTTISNDYYFGGTPFCNGASDAHIFVPSNLVDAYKAHSYWQRFASYITPYGS